MTAKPLRPTIITLSSIPPRLPHIGPVLHSLLDQDLAAAGINLYIPRSYRRFPGWDGSVPDLPQGVTMIRVEQDDGPATKILPALRAYHGQDVDLLYCDDDSHYPPDWHSAFKAAAQDHPEACIAAMGFELHSLKGSIRPSHRLPRAEKWERDQIGAYLATLERLPQELPFIRTSGFNDIAMGHGGVLVRPEWFDIHAFDLPPRIWAVDDIWLSGHLEAQGIPIWADHRIPKPRTIMPLHMIRPLVMEATEGLPRDAANTACVHYWRQKAGIWPLPTGIKAPATETSEAKPDRVKKAAVPKRRPNLLRRLMRRLRRRLSSH